MSVQFRFTNIAAVRSSRADLAVVIDVLRAFTVSAWVHHRGAKALWLAESNSGALALKKKLGPDALAMKDGDPAPGFELSNSPDQISSMDLAGKIVVQRTTNGTVGTIAAAHLPVVLTASLVNASATARAIRELNPGLVDLVVTGADGGADEDLAAAELISALVQGDIDSGAYEDRVRSSRAAVHLLEKAAQGHPGVGFHDVELATRTDQFPWVMQARQTDLGTRLDFTPC